MAAASTIPASARPAYPASRVSDHSDVLHGTVVPDPFRYLEEVASDETKAWVSSQVECTNAYFRDAGIEDRAKELAGELKSVWDYDRVYPPHKEGEYYYFGKKVGTQNQPVVMRTKDASPEGLAAAEPFLNVNVDYPEGTVALTAVAYSDDGALVAYGLSKGGSDWFQIRVRRASDGVDLEDIVPWARYSSIAWRKDGAGFFYCRYKSDPAVTMPDLRRADEAPAALADPSPAGVAPAGGAPSGVEAGMETGASVDQMVYYHQLGTHPASDRMVHKSGEPEWVLGVEVSDDGRYLFVSPGDGCDPVNRLFVGELQGEEWAAWLAEGDAAAEAAGGATPVAEGPELPLRKLVDDFRAEYSYLANDGDTLWLKTNLDAPRGRIVTVDLPSRSDGADAWIAAG